MTFKKAIQILKKDKVFNELILPCNDKVQARFDTLGNNDDLYLSLLRSIVSQQLSTKAANTIFGRFLDLFPNKYPIAALIIATKDEQLRAVGLSFQKISYIKAVAQYSLTNNLSLAHINQLSNDEIIAELTTIKGVGKWTVEMILIFGLKRLDVFPYDDLIIKNGIIKRYNITSKGKQLKADCYQIAEKWKPYRSVASLFLWESKVL